MTNLVDLIRDTLVPATALGIAGVTAEDDALDGRTIVVEGKRVVSFGSCGYLGVELHPIVRQAAADAALRYGTQFATARAYLSAPEYPAAERALARLFGRPVLITPNTTLTSISLLNILLAPGRDAVLLDAQVHANVQFAAKVAVGNGVEVRTAPHNGTAALDRMITELERTHERVWYMADGLYSMYGDFPPADQLNDLFAKHPKLWLYADDAHAGSWYGRHGRGFTLEHLDPAHHDRAIVVCSLNKSFGTAGAALTFPNEDLRRLLLDAGTPMLFSGPVQPPMLGAIRASAEFHVTEEAEELRQRLRALIRHFNAYALELGLPLVTSAETPIRFVATGHRDVCFDVVRRLLDAGFFTNFATYPAVPATRSGVRISLTAHHTEADVEMLLDALAEQLPLALAAAGRSLDDVKRAFHRKLVTTEPMVGL